MTTLIIKQRGKHLADIHVDGRRALIEYEWGNIKSKRQTDDIGTARDAAAYNAENARRNLEDAGYDVEVRR